MFLPFQNTYASLPERFFERVNPAPVRNPKLVFWNSYLANELGINVEKSNEQDLAEIFSGNKVIESSLPLAQAYAGHQFAHFVPSLGDGRAIVLGDFLSKSGNLVDVQLKGSGKTKFSSRGDGRAALGPMMRECIVSEALFHLGIPTTRFLALVLSGENVYRETVLPGAVLTRIAASHVRVGTFEYFRHRGDVEGLRILADYVIDRHFAEVKEAANPYLSLLEAVVGAQASLIAKWLSVGFIHGVMNTDNMAVSGESIDFGPCAFMDSYNQNAVFSSIDREGRYAYGNQPSIAEWNLARFAECLLPLIDKSQETSKSLAMQELDEFSSIFRQNYLNEFSKKFGLAKPDVEDFGLIKDFLEILEKHQLDFTLSFASLSDDDKIKDNFPQNEQFLSWLEQWRACLARQGEAKEQIKLRLSSANPKVIARNHQVERAIARAQDHGDFSVFNDLIRVLRTPFMELAPNDQVFGLAPKPDEIVTQTFCGT